MTAHGAATCTFRINYLVLHSLQRQFSRVVTAHSMHSAAWGRRRRTDKHIWRWCCVLSPSWTQQKLPEVYCSATDIPANQIRIHCFKVSGLEHSSTKHAIAESRSKTFDLCFHARKHVDIRSIRNMAVGPCDVLTCGRACRIVECRLREQYERLFSMTSFRHCVLGQSNLVHRATQMDRNGTRTVCGSPRNRTGEGVVHL